LKLAKSDHGSQFKRLSQLLAVERHWTLRITLSAGIHFLQCFDDFNISHGWARDAVAWANPQSNKLLVLRVLSIGPTHLPNSSVSLKLPRRPIDEAAQVVNHRSDKWNSASQSWSIDVVVESVIQGAVVPDHTAYGAFVVNAYARGGDGSHNC
jgi:hypothetical protein